MHDRGYFLEQNPVLSLYFCEPVLHDHLTFFIIDRNTIFIKCVPSHWTSLSEALVVLLHGQNILFLLNNPIPIFYLTDGPIHSSFKIINFKKEI